MNRLFVETENKSPQDKETIRCDMDIENKRNKSEQQQCGCCCCCCRFRFCSELMINKTEEKKTCRAS